ncbi:UpxY family transcription antiterminator [Sporocytophaga myxococcoides]|uniref:UpxY family transcription antiterminator n=1 Tax=Sporocytophaga myxococcoides TaxID=153721 RepID=UPI000491C0F3|nr:UpxY family transcription antiterminator [Sporocytophaga myxococcoides]
MSTTFKQKSQMDVGISILEPTSKKNWYVFHTAPRAEKVVLRELSNKGYDVFLPITKTLRVWNNRQKKIIDQVLFPSYIFVNTEEKYLPKISQTPKITTVIHCGGKPSKINNKCIEGIKNMLDLNQEVSIEANFSEGERVRIVKGPLTGYEGVLLRQQSKTKFGIKLKEINQTVFIDICTSLIEKIPSL